MASLVLEAAGLPVTTNRAWKKPSEAFAQPEATTRGDIAGLDDWVLVTRASVSPGGYSEALATAEALAAIEGRKYAGLIQWRSGAARSHFAVMNLTDFASLLAEVETLKLDSRNGAPRAAEGKEDSLNRPQYKEDSG